MQERHTQERRKDQRSSTYLGGKITTARRLIAVDCIVRNTSGAGARLAVANTTLIPEQFELHIPCRNSVYRVRACWRHLDSVGVEIMSLDASDAPVPIALARRAKRLHAENADLRRRLEGLD
jgi:hypothetical protein